MADIKVLMVLDGNRFNFGPKQASNVADVSYFGISFLTSSLEGSTTPTIQVDRAHRRGASFAIHGDVPFGVHVDTSAGLSSAYQNLDFVFTAGILDGYDVLWMIGDEGLNGSSPSSSKDKALLDSEKKVIADFMKAGGGVFAVGDHDGIGALMCGDLPRVRLMRRWFEWDQAETDAATGQALTPNWSGGGNASNSGDNGTMTDRNDTLQPDSADTKFYFDGQGDPTPQKLRDSSGGGYLSDAGDVHTLLRGEAGAIIGLFPDHMHEGEATDLSTIREPNPPFEANGATGPNPYPAGGDAEFPTLGGLQPFPEVLAYGDGTSHETHFSSTDTAYPATTGKSRGVVSAYDGRAAGIGRVVTGSTFHHYLDKNILGDPMTASGVAGVGPTNSDQGLPAAVRKGITDYYINTVTWLARPRTNVSFWVIKGSYGFEESQGGATFADAFFVAIDGFAPSTVGHPTISFSGPLKDAGATFHAGSRIPSGNGGGVQRVLFPFDVSSIPESAFPTATESAKSLALVARLSIGGVEFSAEAVFELTPGADPYFKNSNGSNPFYLSQDLRVFRFDRSGSGAPFVGFPSGGPTAYIENLIAHLNDPANHFTSSNGSDPFTTLSESHDLTEASSIDSGAYNFAVARVRMKGGSAAAVKVFFRLFATSTNDTDFDPRTTYRSTYDSAGRPQKPLAGIADTTLPMFASSGGSDDYAGAKINDLTIDATASGETWKYFACYLDVFSLNLPGTHHCLVAEIAYGDAPIINSNGVTLSPESSDKLAQRNIQITSSGNPGGFDAHRVPQTFQTRPSRRVSDQLLEVSGSPDELVIDWGRVPRGTVATIYWPEVRSIDVVRLGTILYPNSDLQALDAHTVQTKVTGRLGFIPIPFGTATTFAGLLTLDVPIGVTAGQIFDVVIRRVSTRQTERVVVEASETRESSTASLKGPLKGAAWRYNVGTFQIQIPVAAEEDLLADEENTLSIMKWRLGQTMTTDHWHPVLKRYVSFLSSRVAAFGGDPGAIAPWAGGTRGGSKGHGGSPSGQPKHRERLVERTGKVAAVDFDCFGELRGFALETCSERLVFRAHERRLGKLLLDACRHRMTIAVIALMGDPHEIREIIVRG